MYRVETSKAVDKFLSKHRDIAPRMIRALKTLAQDPYNNTLDIARLRGEENKFRLRIGA